MAIVLIAPITIKINEEELEAFSFIIGAIAVTITSQWSLPLVREALTEPIKIAFAVFIAGFLFKFSQKSIAHNLNRIADSIGVKLLAFLVIVALGILSSVITAIIAALVLVEIPAWSAGMVILDAMEKTAGVRVLQAELNDQPGVCLKLTAPLGDIEAELLASGIADGERRFNLTWHDWLNMRSLIETSRVIAGAARWRENSRGAHFRTDFPAPGDFAATFLIDFDPHNLR
jgi:hypothetical protein